MFYNWSVIGHQKELARLEHDIQTHGIHHAYLFVGPEQIGKFRIAKSFAAILQCSNDFCHACPTCIQIEKKCHPDAIELENDGESIKINLIREIIGRLNMTTNSNYKILLIEDIGRLTEEAANCLLKIVEEPPSKTLFIFTANQLRDIMPTIASRMRILYFKKLPDSVLKEALSNQFPDIDGETLDHVILLSLGRSGHAIQLLSRPELFQELRDMYRHIQFLTEKASLATRMAAFQEISANEQKTKLFLALLVCHLRQMLPKKNVIGIIEEIHRTMNLLSRNVNPRLLLENIALNLA